MAIFRFSLVFAKRASEREVTTLVGHDIAFYFTNGQTESVFPYRQLLISIATFTDNAPRIFTIRTPGA